MLSLLPSCATFWCWFQALRVASQCFSWRWSVDRSDNGDNNQFSAVGLQWCALSRWSFHSKPDGDITWRFCWSWMWILQRESLRERLHIWASRNYKSYTSVVILMCFPLHGMAQVSVAIELRRVVHRHTCQRCQDRGGTGCPWLFQLYYCRIWIRLFE